MNILFMDYDGVINNSNLDDQHEHIELPTQWDQYVPRLTNNIKDIIETYQFKIVVSSTWRKHIPFNEMVDIVNNLWGWDTEVIGYTTEEYLDTDYADRCKNNFGNASHWDRGLQITKWLEDNKHLNINDYYIIDDDCDAGYGHDGHFFIVDSNTGFDENHLTKFNHFISSK